MEQTVTEEKINLVEHMTPAMFFLSVYQMFKFQDEYDKLIKTMSEEKRMPTEQEMGMVSKLMFLQRRIRQEVFSVDTKSGKPKYQLAQKKVTAEFINFLGGELVEEQEEHNTEQQ